MISVSELELLTSFGRLIPMLNEEQKAQILAYIEGMAFMAEKKSRQSEEL